LGVHVAGMMTVKVLDTVPANAEMQESGNAGEMRVRT
jgi:hypothetical protein